MSSHYRVFREDGTRVKHIYERVLKDGSTVYEVIVCANGKTAFRTLTATTLEGAIREGERKREKLIEHWEQFDGRSRRRRRPNPEDKPLEEGQGYVYVARSRLNGELVKIGFTGRKDIGVRMMENHTDPLLILPGGRLAERALHRRFREYRAVGKEWYVYEGDLREWLETVREPLQPSSIPNLAKEESAET